MSRRSGALVLVAALTVLIVGVSVLFKRRLATGDDFPRYSSLRSDPFGTRAFHDALAAVPEVRVERHLRGFDALNVQPPRTILLLGFARKDWARLMPDDFAALNAAVRAGSRLVIAVSPQSEGEWRQFLEEIQEPEKQREPDKETDKKTKSDPAKAKERPKPVVRPVDLKQRWGVAPKVGKPEEIEGPATRTLEASGAILPAEYPWKGTTYFDIETGAGWRVLYQRGTLPVLIERSLGKGTLVLASDVYPWSNEALLNDRSVPLLRWTIGPHDHVVFDEHHLGVALNPGIAALARKYRLGAFAGTMLLVAILYIWRTSALFVPSPPEQRELVLVYHPAAGLESLLRRAVPAERLFAESLSEWRRTASAADQARAEAALSPLSDNAPAANRYNAVVAALKKRRHLSNESSD